RITRVPHRTLMPTLDTVRRVRQEAERVGASLLVVDPALPLGLAAPAFGTPYAVVLHGAEVTVPGRLPVSGQALAAVLRRSRLAVCAGGYPAAEGRRAAGSRMPPVIEVPPGVDAERFVPLAPAERAKVRAALGLPADGLLVVSVSRLVPRKGMDTLVEAAAALAPSFPSLTVAIAGDGRERARLEARVRTTGAPVRVLGRVRDDSLPALYGAADVFVLACRNRWFGLEQEGFGIVFLEAAAAGVPQVAGRSGGAGEAVLHGATGLIVDEPGDPGSLAAALRTLLGDAGLRHRMGEAARRRVEGSFGYDLLARRLAVALEDVTG
ncbi:MAG: glycosyltransferase family 4 protein, partial [Acidimicrobiales bacterium]